MGQIASSMLLASAIGVATLALSATQSAAQQPAARRIGEAHCYPARNERLDNGKATWRLLARLPVPWGL